MKKIWFSLAVLSAVLASAGERTVLSLDEGWFGEIHPEKGEVRTDAAIRLPHNWDDYHGFRHLHRGNQHGFAIYRRTFDAPKAKGARHYLVFDGAGSYLTVSLNGAEICRRRPAGRVVTTLEVTDALKDGANELVVRCDHPSDIKDMGWVCGGCSGNTCESPEPFGLFRSVRLVTTGPARIAPWGVHVWHDGEMKKAFVETEIDFGALAAAGLRLRIACPELGIDETVGCDGQKAVRREYALNGVTPWSPENPKLYAVRAELLSAEGTLLDAEEVRTGFNTVRWPLASGLKERRFLLNGQPLFVHGTSETEHRFGGGLAFAPQEIDARCAELKRLGFNLLREGHEPHDLRYAAHLAESGILYWTGMSTHIYFDTEEFRANFLAEVEQWVKERRNNPAVVIWGLQNESSLPAEFAEKCVALIRRLDPLSGPSGRPVVTCNWGRGTDWNVIQNWTGTYAGFKGRSVMSYDEDLVKDEQLLNGEYGAWRLVGYHSDPDAPWDFNGPWTEEHQARVLYEKLMRAWKVHDRVCGQALWTLFTHENPGRSVRVDEGYRLIDKIGPVNHKGPYSIWGRRTEAWYLYLAYGHYFGNGGLDAVCDKPLSWWLKEGHRLADAGTAEPFRPEPATGAVYLHRMNCGGDRTVDSLGNVWTADDSRYVKTWTDYDDLKVEKGRLEPALGSQDFVEGGVKNAAPADQTLLGCFRYGRKRLVFSFPVPTNAPCTVEMYFVEPGSYGRMFDIAIDGKTVEREFEISKLAPERNAVKRSWTVRTDGSGLLKISFPEVQVNQAVVSAIAVSTDAESAARMPKDDRAPGYPESEGLTWGELTAMTRHKTPESMAALDTKPQRLIGQAMPFGEKDGMSLAWIGLYVAGDYRPIFKVLSGDPVGKTIVWKFQNEQRTQTIAEGRYTIKQVDQNGYIVFPIDQFVNAGIYTFGFSAEGADLSFRGMRQ